MCHLEMHVMWLHWQLLLTSSWHLLFLFWRLFPFTCSVEGVCHRFVIVAVVTVDVWSFGLCKSFHAICVEKHRSSYSRQCCFLSSMVTCTSRAVASTLAATFIIDGHSWHNIGQLSVPWTWLFGNAPSVVQCQEVHRSTALLPLVCFRM